MRARFPVVLAVVTALLGSGTDHPGRCEASSSSREVSYAAREVSGGARDRRRQTTPHPSEMSAGVHRLSGRERQPLAGQADHDREEPGWYLDEMWFVDGTDTPACQRGDYMAAYTSPGSRVVFVCAARFHPPDLLAASDAELLIIHELLHSLGLGENPPTSHQISSQVVRRCN